MRPVPCEAPEDRDVEFAGDSAPAVFEALDCLRVAITIFDSSERLIFANRHFNYLFRSMPARELLIGHSYEDLIRFEAAGGEIVADAVVDLDAFVAQHRRQLQEGEYRPCDIELADGRIIEIKARRTPAGGWIVHWSDVTESRHIFGRLEDAIALSADAFAFFDRNDVLAMCNQDFAEMHGFSAPEDLRGKSFAEIARAAARLGRFVIAGEREEWLNRRIEAHRSGAGALAVETVTGAAFLVRERATQDGGRITVLTDVSDRRRVEAALAEQTDALKRARRALVRSKAESMRQASYLADLTRTLDAVSAAADSTKTTLLRTMSHELKTPLNAIIGFSDLLSSMADSFGPEQVREYAGLIHQGGHNLLRLLNQILDLSKISAGRYDLRRAPLDPGAVLWCARERFQARADAKRIALHTDDCPVGILVEADETAFTNMMQQLIENALNFTQEGGEVRFSVTSRDERVCIAVADNGPGVPREDLERILQPFEQGGRSTTDHPAGAGLGLTLVKALAELHDGEFHIDSAPGAGFTATVLLQAASRP